MRFFFFRVSLSKSFQCTKVNILCGAKTIKVTHTGIAYENIRGMIQYSRQSKTQKQGEKGGAHTAVLFSLLRLQLTLVGGISKFKIWTLGKKREGSVLFLFSSFSKYQIINRL